MMELIYKKHQKWIEIVESFGVNNEQAKDIVSHMYLKAYQLISKGLDISFNDGVNYYYIYKILKSCYIDNYRKYKKIEMLTLRLNKNGNVIALNKEGSKYLNVIPTQLIAKKTIDYNGLQKKFKFILDNFKKTNNNLYKKNKHYKIFNDLHNQQKINIKEYSEKNNINYHQVYSSYNKTKNLIKKELIKQL